MHRSIVETSLPNQSMLTRVTDPAKITEIRDSINEGRLILRTGMHHGRKLSPAQMWAVRRAVENSAFRIGESDLYFHDGELYKAVPAAFESNDVTPAGYGPTL